MGVSLITRLVASRGTGAVTYDILQSAAPVFLEETEERNIYRVVLRSGEFRYIKDAPCFGGFDAELAAGSIICGEVIGSISDHAAAGDNSPDLLVLSVLAKGAAVSC
ncbi:hypothetical protein [Pseudomonas vanderleydeniana]|uniref:Uncharacterized protein n=1 Tax=Pseudomonas vanderleydeniana TaxID=2745495 RepID=A0A9E6PS56_9PSED|nr:hypothetical protein [Pseudomonas vanderleydeniana]QXI31193.1 hypothetical protein HU752_015205 [Pseudomonas vanderleydeniana]